MNHRLIYLDNIRVLLTILVVMFHLAITYGFEAGWYFYDPVRDVVTDAVLTYFILVNQAFFMSLFFGIAGFFTPASYERKGPGIFLKDRFVRLGIPLLLFFVLIDPILSYVYNEQTNVSFIKYMVTEITQDPMGLLMRSAPGPMWFLEALLLFSIGYALVRGIFLRHVPMVPSQSSSQFPKDRLILLFVITLSLLNFLIRVWSPVGQQFVFLQLGHFAPYIGYFVAGILASRKGWLQHLEKRQVKKWIYTSIICMIIFPALLYVGGAFDGHLLRFVGGWHWQSLVYSFWEPFVCIGVTLWLITKFRERFNQHNKLSRFMADHAYTVYFNHALIAVYFSFFIQQLKVYPLLKFMIASAAVLSICFVTAYLMRKAPLLRKVF